MPKGLKNNIQAFTAPPSKYLPGGLRFLLMLVLCFANGGLHAQSGQWVWMKGTKNDSGSYGKMGVENATNNPPARAMGAYWTDKDGDFWMFGGDCTIKTIGLLNDLWKFNVKTGNWVWINGPKYDSAPAGSYTQKGIPGKGAYPPARQLASFWTSPNGDLWLFGGDPLNWNLLNDLWRYNIVSNEWTWMTGNELGTQKVLGIYGTGTKSDPQNTPGARMSAQSNWVSDDNTLWLFGGSGYGADTITSYKLGYLNDLWKYDIKTNQWAFMKGNKLPLDSGHIGKIGIEDSTNLPPAQESWCRWQDAGGNFYLTRGQPINPNWSIPIWKYNVERNNWTWVSGGHYLDADTGKYINYCDSKSGSFPEFLRFNNTPQTYGCNSLFWMFGGFSGFSHNNYGNNLVNELWVYNANTLKWTWVNGINDLDTGSYGIMGVPSATNRIPSRFRMHGWLDKNQNFWAFSGILSPLCKACINNDLWKFIPDTSCFHVNLNATIYNGKDTLLCQGHGVLYDIKYMPNAYAVPAADSTVNNDTLLFKPKATTTYTIYYTNAGCNGTVGMRFTIFVNPAPIPAFSVTPLRIISAYPNIKIHNLTTDAGIQTWQLNGNMFSHNTLKDSTIALPPVAGKYAISLIIKSDSNGCTDTLTKWVDVIDTALLLVPTAFSPNGDGVNDVLYAIVPSANVKLKTFRIYNRWGQQVFETQSLDKGWDGTFNGKPEDVGTYVYYVEAESTTNGKSLFTKGTVTLVR